MIMPMQTKNKRNQRANQRKNISRKKNIQTAEARENAGDQFAIGCGFSSDRLKRWHELSRPITEQSKARVLFLLLCFN